MACTLCKGMIVIIEGGLSDCGMGTVIVIGHCLIVVRVRIRLGWWIEVHGAPQAATAVSRLYARSVGLSCREAADRITLLASSGIIAAESQGVVGRAIEARGSRMLKCEIDTKEDVRSEYIGRFAD